MAPFLSFFALTFVLSWVLWAAAAAILAGTSSPPSAPGNPSGLVFLLGTVAPSLVALALTARAGGRAGVTALLRRVLLWPSAARWYVFAIGYMASPASIGTSPFTVRPSLVAWLTAALLWIGAAYFLVRMREATLPSSARGEGL